MCVCVMTFMCEGQDEGRRVGRTCFGTPGLISDGRRSGTVCKL